MYTIIIFPSTETLQSSPLVDMSESPTGESPAHVQWNSSIETLLSEWCDEAKCFAWMHNETYALCDYRAKVLMIASNVTAAIAGLSNVIAGSTTVNGFQLSWAFGSLAILVSITNMLQEKLGYMATATECKHHSTSWETIRIKLEEQLALPPTGRKDCGTFLKYIRQDINQVSMDGNSKIPLAIRERCFHKFNAIHNFKLPDICGDFEHTRIYVRTPNTGTESQPLLAHESINMVALVPHSS